MLTIGCRHGTGAKESVAILPQAVDMFFMLRQVASYHAFEDSALHLLVGSNGFCFFGRDANILYVVRPVCYNWKLGTGLTILDAVYRAVFGSIVAMIDLHLRCQARQ